MVNVANWANWTYKERHVPARIHVNTRVAASFIAWLRGGITLSSSIRDCHRYSIAIGMLFRNIEATQFVEPGTPEENALPERLRNTVFMFIDIASLKDDLCPTLGLPPTPPGPVGPAVSATSTPAVPARANEPWTPPRPAESISTRPRRARGKARHQEEPSPVPQEAVSPVPGADAEAAPQSPMRPARKRARSGATNPPKEDTGVKTRRQQKELDAKQAPVRPHTRQRAKGRGGR